MGEKSEGPGATIREFFGNGARDVYGRAPGGSHRPPGGPRRGGRVDLRSPFAVHVVAAFASAIRLLLTALRLAAQTAIADVARVAQRASAPPLRRPAAVGRALPATSSIKKRPPRLAKPGT
jgi:hypothetical protein